MNSSSIESLIRVDQAGEYGAVQIYQGQIEALEYSTDKDFIALIKKMQKQEKNHLQTFDKLLQSRNIKPTILQPIWHIAGYSLGYITGKIDKKAAMACTVAVEEVIEKHYQEQLNIMESHPEETELKNTIEKFKAEEEEHKNIALENDAEHAPGYKVLSFAVKSASKLAIWLSKRI